MNEKDKNEMLEAILNENEAYQCKFCLLYTSYSMKFSKSIQRQLVEVQKDFMPEDTEAGQIQGLSLIHI